MEGSFSTLRTMNTGGSVRHFFHTIREKAPVFYYFGLVHLVLVALLILARPLFDVEVMGMHALTKPTTTF